jgi:hypothetical protein
LGGEGQLGKMRFNIRWGLGIGVVRGAVARGEEGVESRVV